MVKKCNFLAKPLLPDFTEEIVKTKHFALFWKNWKRRGFSGKIVVDD